MTVERTRMVTRSDAPVPNEEQPLDMGGGGLLAQASAFAQVAREARQNCEHGDAAEHALLQRRNRSGQ